MLFHGNFGFVLCALHLQKYLHVNTYYSKTQRTVLKEKILIPPSPSAGNNWIQNPVAISIELDADPKGQQT